MVEHGSVCLGQGKVEEEGVVGVVVYKGLGILNEGTGQLLEVDRLLNNGGIFVQETKLVHGPIPVHL